MNKSTSLVVFILGTTGVGKSKLAIELAKQYNGEIISSDSMQLYKDGGEITTNKVTTEEMQGIPHHMMSFLPLETLNYNVSDFAIKTIEIVEDIIARGKLPIVVGGTHYYTCSILWSDSLIGYDETESQQQQQQTDETNSKNNNNNTTPQEKKEDNEKYSYEKLKEIDSVSAEKLHRNDFRKIKRSLDIFYTTGKKQSELVNEQIDKKTLRYRSCLLWLECKDQVILENRLNQRVDDMIKRGLEQEVFSLFKNPLLSIEKTENFTKGITQAIGIKELYNYYLFLNNPTATTTTITSTTDTNLTEEQKLKKEKKQIEKFEKQKDKLYKESIDTIKSHTKRYAIKQVKWISKFSPKNSPLDILKLDSSNLDNWNDQVYLPSKNQFELFLKDINKTGYQDINNNNNNTTTTAATNRLTTTWKKYYCEHCNKELNGDNEWEYHQKSKQHRYVLKKRNNNNKNGLTQI